MSIITTSSLMFLTAWESNRTLISSTQIGRPNWIMWPQQDYQRFAKAQLEVCGRATFARAYWTLKNMNNDWSQEKMINNVTSGWDFDKEHPVQWKKKKTEGCCSTVDCCSVSFFFLILIPKSYLLFIKSFNCKINSQLHSICWPWEKLKGGLS